MKMNRRDFLVGSGALALAGWREVARAAGVPDYYAAHLRHVAERVNALAKTCEDGFWFITDLHVKANQCKSGRLIAELMKRTPLAKTLCGGDLPVAFSKGFPTDRAAVDFAIEAYRRHWIEPIRSAGGLLYTAKGNHDFSVCRSYDTPENRKRGFTYDGRTARAIIMGEGTEKGVVTNPDDPEACYYWFDDPSAKMRYVVADTTDTVCGGDVPWGLKYGMQPRQLRWLARAAFATVPAGCGIVVMHHIPVAGVVGGEKDEATFAPLRRLLEAYQNRGTFEVEGEKFDFSSAKGEIVLDLTGHHHCEMETFQRGVWHATNPCDAGYSDYITRSRPWCGELPKKAAGTVFEQTFDAVQIDRTRGLLHFTRVGGGQDRTFHLKPIVLSASDFSTPRSVGARLLQGQSSGARLTWGCYDADRVTNLKDPKNPYVHLVEYHNEFATITEDGRLLAKKPGEVIVMARDAALNKEIFSVILV